MFYHLNYIAFQNGGGGGGGLKKKSRFFILHKAIKMTLEFVPIPQLTFIQPSFY